MYNDVAGHIFHVKGICHFQTGGLSFSRLLLGHVSYAACWDKNDKILDITLRFAWENTHEFTT